MYIPTFPALESVRIGSNRVMCYLFTICSVSLVKMIGHLMAGRIPSLVWEIQIVCNSCQLCGYVCCSCSWRLFNWIPDRWSAIGTRSKFLFISYGLEDLFICHWIHNSRINRIKFKQSLTEISHTKAHTICSSTSLKQVGLRC